MFEELYLKLKDFNKDNIKMTFEWIQNKKLRELFLMREKPEWKEHIAYFNNVLNDKTQKFFAIYYKDIHIGNCGLKNIIKNDIAELWIYIGNNSFKGKGLGQKACELLINKANNEFHLKSLYLYVLNYNEPALKIYKKLDFYKINMDNKDKEIWKDRYNNLLKMKKAFEKSSKESVL